MMKPETFDTMADLTLEQRNAALVSWLNDLTTVYEKCAAERDAQKESASYLAGKLAEVDRERLRLEAERDALRAVVEQVAYFGDALIHREYEPGSRTVTELVERARQAAARGGGK